MSGHHIDFVAFDLARERDRSGCVDDALAESLAHRLDIVLVEIEFLGDLSDSRGSGP